MELTENQSRVYATQTYPVEDPLDRLDDEELVFEMLKRGYAVAKMDVQDMAEAMK
jgi:hypothetical protein